MECENGLFDYNICHLFRNRRTAFITDKYVCVENIFFFDYKYVYYPMYSCKKLYGLPFLMKDIPNTNAKLIKRTKFKKELNSLMDLYDICEKECCGKILDINSAYSLSVFSNMKRLYIDKKFDELMPDKIEETEYAWLMRESYEDVVGDWVKNFNKISKIKLCQ